MSQCTEKRTKVWRGEGLSKKKGRYVLCHMMIPVTTPPFLYDSLVFLLSNVVNYFYRYEMVYLLRQFTLHRGQSTEWIFILSVFLFSLLNHTMSWELYDQTFCIPSIELLTTCQVLFVFDMVQSFVVKEIFVIDYNLSFTICTSFSLPLSFTINESLVNREYV